MPQWHPRMLIDPGYPGVPDRKRQAWVVHKSKPQSSDYSAMMPLQPSNPLQVPLLKTTGVFQPPFQPAGNPSGLPMGSGMPFGPMGLGPGMGGGMPFPGVGGGWPGMGQFGVPGGHNDKKDKSDD